MSGGVTVALLGAEGRTSTTDMKLFPRYRWEPNTAETFDRIADWQAGAASAGGGASVIDETVDAIRVSAPGAPQASRRAPMEAAAVARRACAHAPSAIAASSARLLAPRRARRSPSSAPTRRSARRGSWTRSRSGAATRTRRPTSPSSASSSPARRCAASRAAAALCRALSRRAGGRLRRVCPHGMRARVRMHSLVRMQAPCLDLPPITHRPVVRPHCPPLALLPARA